MVIFELPPKGLARAVRVGVLGSCRVINPITALRDRGDVRLRASELGLHHSAAEALQSLKIVTGDLRVPDFLSPYIFCSDLAPTADRLRDEIGRGVDIFIVEVSGDRQFRCGEFCLQENYLPLNLVKAHRGALLDWFREVCRGAIPDESRVQSALANLREAGFEAGEAMAELLRHVRLETQDEDAISAALGEMMSMVGGRWIVVGAFEVKGRHEAIMEQRRVLNAKLVGASRRCGAAFYDPTALIVEHGSETALDGGGVDIYEYAPAFFTTVGERLIDLVRDARRPAAARRFQASIHRAPAAVAERLRGLLRRSAASGESESANRGAARVLSGADPALRQKLDDELVSLHRARLTELGAAQSGLYAHYEDLLRRAPLIGRREVAALRLVHDWLPRYDAYAVLRAGLGELALLLAASGRKVTAFEPDRNRRNAIEAGARRLEEAGLLAVGALTIAPTLAPEGPLEGRVLGVGLGAVHFRDEAEAAPIIQRLRAFEALLIDPRTFLRLREDEAERESLAAALAAIGLDERRDYEPEGLVWFAASKPPSRRNIQ